MALKEIATANCTVTSSSGTVSLAPNPSLNSKIDGSGILTQSLSVTVTGASIPGTCEGATGSGSILATAINTKVDGQPVLRQGDSATILVTGANPSSGSPCSFNVNVEISNAGQIKVKAE